MANVLMSGTVEKAAGDAVRLPCDFGDSPILIDGAEVTAGVLVQENLIASYDVTVSPSGPVITNKQKDYSYQISAKIAGGTVGTTYSVTYSIVCDDPDGTTYSRTGLLKVT